MECKTKILEALCSLPADKFVSEYFFDRVPYVFDGHRSSYVGWKTELASSIEVDPACVTIVGSSALGISLNPKKSFKPFDEKSDVDVAVVSSFHFTVAWRYLRTMGHRRTHVDARTRIAWDEHQTRFIYWGTVATDRLLGILPFGTKWLSALNKMSGVPPTVGRNVNLRIYSDFESLRAYQVHSVKHAREDIMSEGEANASVS